MSGAAEVAAGSDCEDSLGSPSEPGSDAIIAEGMRVFTLPY